jgi:hypothetical protein
MSNKSLSSLLVVLLLLSFNCKAQDTESKKKSITQLKDEKNPLNVARVNFYKKTILAFNEYLDTDSGSFNTTDFRYTHPFKNRSWNFRADLPLVSGNTSNMNKTAIGDISFSLAHIPYLTNRRGVSIRARVTSNSSNTPEFGSGKWVFTPTVFYGQFLDKKGAILWTTYLENKFSFAGDSSRAKVNAMNFDNTVTYSFSKSWVSTELTIGYNAVSKQNPNSVALEYGTKFTPDTMLYFHPSIGLGSERGYNYGLEFGLVVLY